MVLCIKTTKDVYFVWTVLAVTNRFRVHRVHRQCFRGRGGA